MTSTRTNLCLLAAILATLALLAPQSAMARGPWADQDAPPPPPDMEPGMGPGMGPMGDHPGGPGMRAGMALHKILADLDLSDQQRQQIKDIRTDFHDQMTAWQKSHADELAALREESKTLREQEKPERERARALHEKVRDLLESDSTGQELEDQVQALRAQHAQIKAAREAHRALMDAQRQKAEALHADAPKMKDLTDKILAVLTDEQRQIANQRLEEMQKEMESRPAPGAHGSPDQAGDRPWRQDRPHMMGKHKPSQDNP